MKNQKNFKVGDVVLCINAQYDLACIFSKYIKILPEFMGMYTVRNLDDVDAIRLKEIVNPIIEHEGVNYGEPSFYKYHFIKLQDAHKIFINHREHNKNKVPHKEEQL